MSKQVITVDGQDRIVREDTAKAFRGVHWALFSLAAFVIIALAILMTGLLTVPNQSGDKPAPVIDRGQ